MAKGRPTTTTLQVLLTTLALTTPGSLATPNSSDAEQCIPGSYKADLTSNGPSSDLSNITSFGLELFKNLFPYNTTDRNFFFSPYSVWSALSLAYFGAEGDTKAELEKVLRVEDKIAALTSWKAVEFLYLMRQKNQTNYTFKVANRAYFDDNVVLRECLNEIFPTELQRIDFEQPSAAAKEINEFVRNTTEGRIKKLVNPGHLQGARMVLVNAAFFKGVWLYQFKKSNTKKALFYTSLEEYTFTDMMVQKGNFRYGVSEELGASILELPYTGEAVSMYILLPPFISGENGFNAMVERLTAPLLHQAIAHTWRTQLDVMIPKFKLEEMMEQELIEGLSKMGVRDLFDTSRANLTVFSEQERLSVGKSVHRAFVEVNEEGTEAAAATSLISWRIARPVTPSKFEANHPFLFLIYDNLTNNVLFLGAYKNPKAAMKG